ncbi:hypothetical protein ZIOFF_048401 [Zingiber officinale]|uniref:Glutamine amidotransferase type-2 domain-containing protein n=1 Tax=Zingiber officinale TaxID=94328 RepID=A0A8J5FR53_ZINOF|nr:hypothetical protein ZIOFF_048401 [Zingiber officinale]
MCGIALLVSGIDIVGCDLCRESLDPPSFDDDEPALVVEDLKDAIGRRGPDSLGSKKVFLTLKSAQSSRKHDEGRVEEDLDVSIEADANENLCSRFEGVKVRDHSNSQSYGELYFLGATLQLRGVSHIIQPLVDSSGNILLFNGEIFGGIHVSDDRNDAETLLHVLERHCCCNDNGKEKVCSCSEAKVQHISETISMIKGPWALVYWQRKSRTLWFGRDVFGRRSLLVHWPTLGDPRLLLSSVSPASAIRKASCTQTSLDTEAEHSTTIGSYWEELPCGIYSIHFKAFETSVNLEKNLAGEVRKHNWIDTSLNKLVKWERTSIDPKMELFSSKHHQGQPEQLALPSAFLKGMNHARASSDIHNHMPGDVQPAEKVLSALRKSVRRRTVNRFIQATCQKDKMDDHAPIAVLFSGGLDSMILAAILDQCLDPGYTIDLLNVSFDSQLAPDRVSARTGLAELQKIAPHRRSFQNPEILGTADNRWRLVEIDAILSDLTCEAKHLLSLIHPAKTYMDLNIGMALWLAAGGDGWVDGSLCNLQNNNQRYQYKSSARILIVGSGADEQCAGYGRHRTKYRLGGYVWHGIDAFSSFSWVALHEEMRLDVQRIWKRNMGRDDRCISDRGKEARFPFLDEDVIRTLLELPLWDIADLDRPVGIGDKKILREVSRLLGLEQAAAMPKRAIQFGSRIARESNRKNFGSNRAANQASAGSVDIHQLIN